VEPLTVFAHLGHWYVGGPVFLGPVVLLIIAIKLNEWRERRRAASQGIEPTRVETRSGSGQPTIAITGRLDVEATFELETELGVLAQAPPRVILDLRSTTVIDEEALPRLQELQGRSLERGLDWAVVPGSPAVQRSLEASGLLDLAEVVSHSQSRADHELETRS
jgi:anti-anti-sigma regulatory factor